METVGVRSPGHRDTYFKFSETLMVIMILVLKDDDDVHREGEAAKVNGGPATPH